MATHLGFECVVRALRSGYEVRRKCWAPLEHIRFDLHTTKQIILQRGKEMSFYTATSEDIMAEDWESFHD